MTEHVLLAERTLLGACLISGALVSEVSLRESDFLDQRHGATWAALVELSTESATIDLVSVLARAGKRAGNPAYLASHIDGVPRHVSIAEWAEVIATDSRRRRLVADLASLAADAQSGKAGIEEMLARADRVARSESPRAQLDNAELVSEALRSIDARQAAKGGIVGYRTGINGLDDILQGITGGRMGVIAARLGVGKSVLALQVASEIAQQGPDKTVLFVSLEMSGAELMERRIAADSRVNLGGLWYQSQAKREEEYGRVVSSASRLMRSNLVIVDDAWTVPEIARHAYGARDLSAVFIDYYQLLEPSGRAESRTVSLAHISHDLRKMAKRLGVPVIVVAQLNREAVDRNKRQTSEPRAPEIHEIEGSDALGKDCHWCVLIAPGQERDRASLHVRKNRSGIKGAVEVSFDGALATFTELVAMEWHGGAR